jgi:hypothetical protein
MKDFINKKNTNTNYWRYVNLDDIFTILDQGVIQTAVHYFIPIVLLSSNQDYEPACIDVYLNHDGQIVLYGRDEKSALGVPSFRISANPERVQIYPWKHYRKKMVKKLGNAIWKSIESYEKQLIFLGSNPSEWHVSYGPIQLADCHMPFEVWNGNAWESIDETSFFSDYNPAHDLFNRLINKKHMMN